MTGFIGLEGKRIGNRLRAAERARACMHAGLGVCGGACFLGGEANGVGERICSSQPATDERGGPAAAVHRAAPHAPGRFVFEACRECKDGRKLEMVG